MRLAGESRAEEVADGLTSGRPVEPQRVERPAPAHGAARAAGLGAGKPLPRGLASDFGGLLGRDLSGVRLHTDAPAAAAAHALGALAFAVGDDIVLAPEAYAPDTAQCRALLAHEIAHVVERDDDTTVMLQPTGAGTVTDDWIPPDLPVYGPEFIDVIEVPDIPLPGRRPGKQSFRFHYQVDGKREEIKYWVVPVSRLALKKTVPPVQTTGLLPPPGSHPDIPPGSTVVTPDGARLTALASNPKHVITAQLTKFAVGAASTTALKLSDGTAIIIDAGVNNDGLSVSYDDLQRLTIDRLETFLGKDTLIRELLISHAHEDHMSLAAEILKRHPVSIIRLNDIMRRWEGSEADRTAMKAAQDERIAKARASFATDMAAKRAEWETKGAGAAFGVEARDGEWAKHVEAEFAKSVQGQTAIERVLVQTAGNVQDVVDFDLRTGERRGPVPFAAEDPYVIRETQMEASKSRHRHDPSRAPDVDRPTDADIDMYASSFVIAIANSSTAYLILPDLRAKDLKHLQERFAQAMGSIKRQAHIWDASHHLQKGWYKVADRLPASQLLVLVDFLMKFRSAGGADAVVVSGQLDVTKGSAKTLVDPVVLRFLRSLGFEAYVAASAADIQVVDITTATGTQLTGIIGSKAPGTGEPSLSTRRAKLALEKLEAERRAEQVRLTGDGVDATQRAASEKRIGEINALETQLKGLLEQALNELVERTQQDPATTASLNDPPRGPNPKQLALDEWLARHGYDLPVVRDMKLSEMALVVLDRNPDLSKPAPEGSPGARARRIAELRSRVNELGLRIKAGETAMSVQAELLTTFTEYKTVLESELNPADPAQKPLSGTSRDLLEADLATVKSRLAALTEGPGTTEYSRTIGKGEVVTQHATVLKPLEPAPKPESKLMGGARKVAAAMDRVGGVVMVVTTVAGEGELMNRWRQGKATSAEVAVGTVKNVGSGAVGLLMLKGVQVHPAVFVIIAVLEVGEAAARKYETEEQRDIGILHAAASSAVNLGCAALGMGLMAIPTPVTFIAGLLISTLGPFLLKLFGVDEKIAEWAERRGAFNPGDVVGVLQKLRKLLQAFQLVVGAIQLAKRADDKSDPTFTNLPDAIARAGKVKDEETKRAMELQSEIMGEFATAYKDARTNYAGLKDLDDYRSQFYFMRHQAGLAEAGDRDLTSRTGKSADQTFKAIDATMSIDDLSADQVRKMPQWKRLDTELGQYMMLVASAKTSSDHAAIRDKDRRLQAMVDNARYRLDPGAQGKERTSALLSKTSVAGTTYQAELALRETNLAYWRRRFTERVTGEPIGPGRGTGSMPWPLTSDWAFTMAEKSIDQYLLYVAGARAPKPEFVAEMWRTTEGVAAYRRYVEATPGFRVDLEWLQSLEQMIDGHLSQAKSSLDAEPADRRDGLTSRLAAARERMKQARSERFARRGIVYLSDLPGLETEVWKQEAVTASALFTKQLRDVRELSEAEELALVKKRSSFESDTRVQPPVLRQLKIIKSPTAVGPDGNLLHIFRLEGDVPINLQYASKPTVHFPRGINALVGIVASPQFEGARYPNSPLVEVMPLNDHAIRLLKGGSKGYLVYRENLAPIPAAELERRKTAVESERVQAAAAATSRGGSP